MELLEQGRVFVHGLQLGRVLGLIKRRLQLGVDRGDVGERALCLGRWKVA